MDAIRFIFRSCERQRVCLITMRLATLHKKTKQWLSDNVKERASFQYIIEAIARDDKLDLADMEKLLCSQCEIESGQLTWDSANRILYFGNAENVYFVYGPDGVHPPTVMTYKGKRVNYHTWKFWEHPTFEPSVREPVKKEGRSYVGVCPDDVWRNVIFRYLSAADVLSCRLVNKHMCGLASDDRTWLWRLPKYVHIPEGRRVFPFVLEFYFLIGADTTPAQLAEILLKDIDRGMRLISMLGKAWIVRYGKFQGKYFQSQFQPGPLTYKNSSVTYEPDTKRRKTTFTAKSCRVVHDKNKIRDVLFVLGYFYNAKNSYGPLVWLTKKNNLRVAWPESTKGCKKIANPAAWIRETMLIFMSSV